MTEEFMWDGNGEYGKSGLPVCKPVYTIGASNHKFWCNKKSPGKFHGNTRECTLKTGHTGYHESGSMGGKAITRWYTDVSQLANTDIGQING